MNTPIAPSIAGARSTIQGTISRMTVDKVFPTGSTTVYNWPDRGYRLNVAATGTATEFLHVLGLDSAVTSSIASDATGQRGVRVTLADGRTVLARFNRTTSGGSLLITQGATILVNETLASGIDTLAKCVGGFNCE